MDQIYNHQYDIKAKTEISNRDGSHNKLRKLDGIELHDALLYIAWSLEHSKNVKYIEANLLPDLGLKIAKLTFINEEKRNKFGAYDYHIDIADINGTNDHWTLDNLYLDILLWEKKRLEVLDTDEFVEASRLGYVSDSQQARALESLHDFVNNMSLFDCDLDAYLSSKGIKMLWK